MKKIYIKPEAEYIEFYSEETLAGENSGSFGSLTVQWGTTDWENSDGSWD